MSAQELITEHLDLWTGAVTQKSTRGRGSNSKIELTGIKKLRELILELGVRGKLVSQNPDEKPASSLIEMISDNKAELLSAGLIKKSARLPAISPDEAPFTAPRGWHWIRLGELVQRIGSGATPRGGKSAYVDKGIPFLRSQNIWNDEINLQDVAFITPETHERMSNTHVYPNDILLNITGASLGRCTIVPTSLETANVSQHVTIIRTIEPLNRQFLHYLILSPYVQSMVWGRQVGMAREGLSKKVLEQFEIPLPPLEEQHRIVQKVDELMALCDRLEQQTSDQLEAHETLVDTLLGTLTQSENATELADNWARLAAHFDTLFTTEQSIDKLKQTILQLAVMGRLVKQDEGDEPATILLETIADQKRRLVNEGVIRKPKLLASPGNGVPYSVPEGWRWEKLGNFALVGTGATPSRGRADYYSPSEHPWVTSGETSQGYIFDTKERVSSLAVKETNITIYPEGTLIVAMYGQGKTRGQISELKVAAGTNQACAAIQPLNNSVNHRRYIKLCFVKLYDEIREGAAGGAQPNLNTGKIANTLIPLPPMAEQHRIVQKVDELMTLCDQLKERLSQASETRCQLADTIVEATLG